MTEHSAEYAWNGMPLCEHGYQFDCDVCSGLVAKLRQRIADDDGTRYTLEEIAEMFGVDLRQFDGKESGD